MRFASTAIQRQIARIVSSALQRGLRNTPQQDHRIVIAGLPRNRVQPAEESALRMLPAPHQIQRQLWQAIQFRRDGGTDKEFFQRSNLKGHVG